MREKLFTLKYSGPTLQAYPQEKGAKDENVYNKDTK